MNYYERHLGDYAKDTGHLSMLEHGAYNLLLDRYYSKEEGIPVGDAYRVARAHSKQERAAVDKVLSEFFVQSDGVWIKNRVQEEIAAAHIRIGAAQSNGKLGGRPRTKPKTNPKGTREKPTGLLLGSENETQSKALQSPVSDIQSPDQDSRRGDPVVGTLKTQIFRLAKQLSIDGGVVTSELKAHSETEVWQALGATVSAKPGEPLPYFRGCLKPKGEAQAEQRRQIP